jgi:hypothetical protein
MSFAKSNLSEKQAKHVFFRWVDFTIYVHDVLTEPDRLTDRRVRVREVLY